MITKIGWQVDLKGLNDTDAALERINRQVKDMSQGAVHMLDKLEKIGKQMTMRLTVPLAALGTVSVMARVKQEESEKQWGVLLGNMEAGVAKVRELKTLGESINLKPDEVLHYAESLKSLNVPVDQINEKLTMFADIAAGKPTLSIDQLINEYAKAQNNPALRGLIIQRMFKEGAIDQATLIREGLNPRTLRKEGMMGAIGKGQFNRLFADLWEQNKGKAAQLGGMGEEIEHFWNSLTNLRAALGKMLQDAGLEKFFVYAKKFIDWLTRAVEGAPKWLKIVAVGIGTILALIGPVILAITTVGHAMLFAKLAMVGLKIAGFEGMSAILSGAGKVSMAIAGITGQILLGVAAALALIYIIREINVFSKGAQKQGLYEKSLTETKPGEVNLLTGKGSIYIFVPHTMTAEQRRMTDFANGIKSTARAGKTSQNSLTVQVTVPPGTTPQQVAGIKAGAEAAHRPILDSINRQLVLSINKAHR